LTENFLVKIKGKANELGIVVKDELFQLLSKSTMNLQSVVGKELVLATVVPMIPSLIADTLKRELLEKHVPDLGERLKENYSQLNHEFIKTPEGRKLFKETVTQILEETNEEKIEFLKKFLLRSYLVENPDFERIRKYMKCQIR
jgi:hypothetical protein